ncbi:MAG: hypothetical protein QM775_34720 [Pirellulales bacterium]
MQIHSNAADQLLRLPESVTLSEVAHYGYYGGMYCLKGERPDGVVVSICLGPTDDATYEGQLGQLTLGLYESCGEPGQLYLVVARSILENQILSLLKSSTCADADVDKWRNELVDFVESDQYLVLHSKSSGK